VGKKDRACENRGWGRAPTPPPPARAPPPRSPAPDPPDPPMPDPTPSVGRRGGGVAAQLVERARPRLVRRSQVDAGQGGHSHSQPNAAATSSAQHGSIVGGLPRRQPKALSIASHEDQPAQGKRKLKPIKKKLGLRRKKGVDIPKVPLDSPSTCTRSKTGLPSNPAMSTRSKRRLRL
jgi:hypothetical protein